MEANINTCPKNYKFIHVNDRYTNHKHIFALIRFVLKFFFIFFKVSSCLLFIHNNTGSNFALKFREKNR